MDPSTVTARPGAVLVGGPGDAAGFAAERYGSILWLVDAVGALLPLQTVPDTVIHTVVLDGLDAWDVGPALDRFQRRSPFQVPQLFVSRQLARAPGTRHAGVLEQVHGWFARLEREQALVQRVGFARQKNFLLNLAAYVRRQMPANWVGALRGVPAFVCGSGPSLDVSVAALAPVADRGVVFAADSALRALARHGITADFALSMSARKPPERCLTAGAEPRRMLISTQSPASWREAIPTDRLYFIARAHPTEDWAGDAGLATPPLAVAENCGLTVLDLARLLGCAPIYLFGLDLAADTTNPAVHHNQDADPAIDRQEPAGGRDLPSVPGNYAEQVPTFLHSDWSACDARLATWPDGLVINVNDRGARLRQTRLMHPRQFSLSGDGAPKRPALAHLSAPGVENPAAVRTVFALVAAQGARGCRAVAGLRRQLEQCDVAGLAAGLTRLLADREFALVLGSFTQKVLPHLATADATIDFWTDVLDEFEELCCLAAAVDDDPVG